MIHPLRTLIQQADLEGIRKMLEANPELANEGLPYDEQNMALAPPLHRICDGVFCKDFSEEQGIAMVQLFLSYGAKVNGVDIKEKKDTPLLAASSLHADRIALLLIDEGANIHHRGCYGGTALHWAAWTGRDLVVKRLIEEKADIHQRCYTHQGTPLLWAVHGYKYAGPDNQHHQMECARLLLAAGADKSVPNIEDTKAIEFLEASDEEMLQLLR